MAAADCKTCGKCGESLPLTAFYRAGKAGYCIPCEKAYKREHYLANAARIKAKVRAWSAANPERKSATNKEYRAANPERMAQNARGWTARNPDKRRAIYTEARRRNLEVYRQREADYRERRRAECNARIKEWKARNPHATVAYAGKRRAAELQAIPLWADLDAIAAIYKQARTLGTGRHHVDHAVPLISDRVCGLHCAANLQILTASENSRKNNRHWPDMWSAL